MCMATKRSQNILVCVEMCFRVPSLEISVLRDRMPSWHSRRSPHSRKSPGPELAVLFCGLGSSKVSGLWVVHSVRSRCGMVAGIR